MIDNSKARGLQEIYKAGGKGALNALAIECECIALKLVKAQCRKYHLHFEWPKIKEFAHDAAAQFITQYLKHADYNVRYFSERIRRDVLNVMFARARNKQDSFEDGQLQHDKTHENLAAPEGFRVSINPSIALDELVADHPQGKKIAADLWRSKSYSQAIRRIAAYVDREWIYGHAEKVRFVFHVFHWKPRLLNALKKRSRDPAEQHGNTPENRTLPHEMKGRGACVTDAGSEGYSGDLCRHVEGADEMARLSREGD